MMIWKIKLFVACVKMDVKNYLLQRRIMRARKRAAALREAINLQRSGEV